MIDRRKMVACVIEEGHADQDVQIAALHRMLGGIVTRSLVLDHTDVVRCVIHESLLYKFLADQKHRGGAE